MKEIRLSNGMVTLVDDADFEMLSQWKWHASRNGGRSVGPRRRVYYAVRNVKVGDKWTMQRMHHLIISPPSGQEVDHENGNGLDNQRSNLRPATDPQNGTNRGPNLSNPSRLRGVSQEGKRWRARLIVNGKQFNFGTFATLREAAAAYDAGAQRLCGEFAWTNVDHVTA